MYGGSGMCPMASTTSATLPPCVGQSRIGAAAECVLCEHFGFELGRRLAEPGARARLHLLPGMHQHVPSIVVDLAQQQALDVTAAGLATAEQPRRHDARVVDDEQV